MGKTRDAFGRIVPGKDVIVAPSPRGGWAVMRAGNKRPSRVKRTKAEAILVGRIYAKEEGAALIVRDEEEIGAVADAI